MIKIIWILFLAIMCFACNESNIELKKIESTENFADKRPVKTVQTDPEVTVFRPISNAKIVWYDDINQRYFVAMDSSFVYDYDKINEIANEISKLNTVEQKTSISFFNDPKWANYKDELFEETDPTFSSEEYQNWKNIIT